MFSRKGAKYAKKDKAYVYRGGAEGAEKILLVSSRPKGD